MTKEEKDAIAFIIGCILKLEKSDYIEPKDISKLYEIKDELERSK